ncbi:MAG: PBSX family phage terminase large subunit [Clostridia bacterium]|nr:PBSX family phage terminase large subunit [Clostridia bacterium]
MAIKSRFEKFSPKQLRVLNWWCENSPFKNRDVIICDGAVRSGKTLCMSISFVMWAFYRYNGMNFAVCGKTIRNVKRNIILPLMPILKELGFDCELKSSENLLLVSAGGRMNRIYFYGGKDESSASLIQGMTLAGILFDEAALMPRSFVEQALARCSVSGAKLWFNCNPENPYHWFYTEWIKKKEERNALYVHFLMSDNPSLSREVLERYEKMFSGAFYQRFILGRWVKAEGLVYPFMQFDMFPSNPTGDAEEFALSLDYGTVNPTSCGLWEKHGASWYRVDEYYFDSRRQGFQRTDEEHLREIKALLGGRKPGFVVADPSAASMITLMEKEGLPVIKADNDVMNGIRKVSSALKSGRIKICRCCKDAVREFALYSWSDSSAKDSIIKENDHAMDDIRYFASELERRENSMGLVFSAERN